MSAVIICNGSIRDYGYYKEYIDEAQCVICADGGAAHAKHLSVNPDILLGDFDSISESDLSYYRDAGIETVKFPEEKDMTDTELAVEHAIDKGYKTIVIIGGMGSRFDHTLSNVFLLKKILDKGAKGVIIDEHNEIALIDESIIIKKEAGTKVTLLPLTEKVEGVTTRGLYYPLDNATVHIGSTLGVSNEFTGETAEVTLKSGLLLVIKSRD